MIRYVVTFSVEVESNSSVNAAQKAVEELKLLLKEGTGIIVKTENMATRKKTIVDVEINSWFEKEDK